jgi:hypothetical protein
MVIRQGCLAVTHSRPNMTRIPYEALTRFAYLSFAANMARFLRTCAEDLNTEKDLAALRSK